MKPTLIIGISAYNEATNIGNLLSALSRQKILSAELIDTIVVSDASTDTTDDIVRSFGGSGVTLVRIEKRGGVLNAHTTILRKATSDILVLLDADILPENELFIEGLIKPIIDDTSVGLTSAVLHPATPGTFVEKILARNHEWKNELFISLGDKSIYTCFGPAQALSRDFYSSIVFPENVPFDAIMYFLYRKAQLHFILVKYPRAIFRCPTNTRDHIKQSLRFISGKKVILNMYPEDAKNAYHIPAALLVKKVFIEFFQHPILFTGFVWLNLLTRTQKSKSFVSVWDMAESSKKI